MTSHRDDLEPMFVGTYDITDDIAVYVNTDVRFLAMSAERPAILLDSRD